MDRLRFLTRTALATLGVAAGAVGWSRRQIIDWLKSPEMAPASTGVLPAATSATLLAAAHALLGEPITDANYADYYRWRAANLAGYRELYVGFARYLDAVARRSGARDFASAPLAMRRQTLEGVTSTRRWVRIADGLLHRDKVRWRQRFVRETIWLYAHTDGWLRIGYDGWPGISIGMEGPLTPPRAAA
jgi:hypothetical protein